MRILVRTVMPAALLVIGFATAAAAQVNLQLRTPEGVSTVTTQVNVKQILTLAGMDIPTESQVSSRAQVTSSKPGADGSQRIEEKTTGFKIKLATPVGNLDYDLDKPDPKAGEGTPLQPLVAGFGALKGLAYTVVVRDGKAAGVEGIEEALGKVPAASVEALRSQLNPNTIKREWQQSFDALPGKPVKKGDTWTRTEFMNLGAGQILTYDVQYEYQDPIQKDGRTLDKVSIVFTKVTYSVEGAGLGGLKVLSSDLKVDQSFGQYLLDREAGTIVERSTNVHITGPMLFDFNGAQLPGKVDLSLDVSSVTK